MGTGGLQVAQNKKSDVSEIIAEEFGANATYVEGLLERFRSNPDLVDESWRAYFSELDGDLAAAPPSQASDNGKPGLPAPVERESISVQTSAATAPAPKITKAPAAPESETHVEIIRLRGAAQKIV